MTALEALDSYTSAELRKRYLEVLGQPPPHKASRKFLISQLAWALQAIQCGEDPEALRASLLHRFKSPRSQHKTHYKPGTRLVREWQGQVYEVGVLEDGYEYGGEVYRSLSPIANQITGNHCSGPRFFGLK